MSVMREPKVEPEDVCEPDCQELYARPNVRADLCELSASSALHSEMKEEAKEEIWEAVEDGPPVAETPVESAQKCFSQVSVYPG